MNKLLISMLSLAGVAGISTGSYFLLRDNEKSEQKTVVSNAGEAESGKSTGTYAQENGGVEGASSTGASAISGTQEGSEIPSGSSGSNPEASTGSKQAAAA